MEVSFDALWMQIALGLSELIAHFEDRLLSSHLAFWYFPTILTAAFSSDPISRPHRIPASQHIKTASAMSVKNHPSTSYVFHEAFDPGTSHFKIAVQHVRDGTLPGTASTIVAVRDRGGLTQRQIVGFIVREGQLVFTFGEELENYLSGGHDVPFTFERLKVCYFASPQQQSVRSSIRQCLAHMRQQFPGQVPDDVTEDWLQVKLLTAVRLATVKAEQRGHRRWKAQEVANMRRVAFLLVPEISTPATDDKMLGLMKEAGFTKANGYSRVVLASETECAGAWRKHELTQRQADMLDAENGAHVLIGDGGGLTFVSQRFLIYTMAD